MPVLDFDSYTPSLKPQAKQLARERWKFLNRMFLSLDLDDADHRVMFPLGRADRMYHFVNASAQGPLIECYQHKNGKDKRVYRVLLEVRTRPAGNDQPVPAPRLYTNILDAITQEWGPVSSGGPAVIERDVLSSEASQYARNDLALKRDFVEYIQEDLGPSLRVSVNADIGNGEGAEGIYDYLQDPFTNKDLDYPKFYQKYGLPVTPEELHKMRFGKKRQPSDHIAQHKL